MQLINHLEIKYYTRKMLKMGYIIVVASIYHPNKLTGFGVSNAHYYQSRDGMYWIGSRQSAECVDWRVKK